MIESPWLLVPEAALYAKCGESTILAALRDGSLDGSQIKKGGTWRVKAHALDAWLDGKPASVDTHALGRRRTA